MLKNQLQRRNDNDDKIDEIIDYLRIIIIF